LRRIEFWKQCLIGFLFPPESDNWLGLLRFGLGLQVVFYCLSIRTDWTYLLAGKGGLISRNLSETILALESPLIPRLGWIVALGGHFGLGEQSVLSIVWYCLVTAGCLLLLGLFSRAAAIATWVLHLATIKSADLLSYGMDNLTTIGLFYLMLSPLPDHLSLDWQWRDSRPKHPDLLGFWRRVLQTHMCLIYFFSGIAKCLGLGWWNGNSLWRALTRPPFDLISADTLVRFKYLLPIAGVAVWSLEIGYPFFIWHRRLRRPWLIAILLMHVGVGITMGMYLFAWVMIVLNLAAFGPGILWHQRQTANDCSSPVESLAPSPNN
jgi:Vitamin K-dependent gamma-carboxylase